MEVKNIYSNVCKPKRNIFLAILLFMVEECDSEKPEASKKASIFAFCHAMSHRSSSHHGRKVAYINILSKSYVSFYISICKLTQPGHFPRRRRWYYRWKKNGFLVTLLSRPFGNLPWFLPWLELQTIQRIKIKNIMCAPAHWGFAQYMH